LAEIQRCKIKAEEYSDADHEIGKKKLILFSSQTKGFELANKKEIFADGKWYDIVETQTSNGIILYYALGDKDEDRYVHNLADFEKNNSWDKSLPGKTIKLFNAKYFSDEKYHHSICLSLDLLPRVRVLNDALFYPSLFKDIFSPPPDHLFS
jgi:hypothetical protein